MIAQSLRGKSLVFQNLLSNLGKGFRYTWTYEQYGHKHALKFCVFENGQYSVEVSRVSKQNRQDEPFYTSNLENIIKYLNKRVIKSSITKIEQGKAEVL